MSDPLPESPSEPRRWRASRGWLILIAALALTWALAWAWLERERDALVAAETAKLEAMVRAFEGIVAQHLRAGDGALRSIAEQLPRWHTGQEQTEATDLLRAIAEAMPGVQSILVRDTDGRLLAAAPAAMMNRDWGSSDLPPPVLPDGAADLLQVSEPFVTAGGRQAMTLSRVVRGADGQPRAIVSINLDSSYFDRILDAALSTPNTWSLLVHEDGLMFNMLPPNADWVGRNVLKEPNSMLRRYLDDGRDAVVIGARSVFSADQRLAAARTVRPAGLPMDHRLIVAVGRSLSALEQPWQRQRRITALVVAALSALSLGSYALWWRRRSTVLAMYRERRRLQRDGADRLALALDGADLGLWDWDIASGRVQPSARCGAMLGLAPEALGRAPGWWLERVHPDDRERLNQQARSHLRGERAGCDLEYRLLHHDGHWVWVHAKGRVMARSADGRALRFIGTLQDISEAKQYAMALHERWEHLRAILDHMVDAVITIDEHGLIDSFNPAASRIFGYPTEEVMGRNVSMLMSEPDASQHDQHLQRYLQGAPARVIGIGREVTGRRRNGALFPVSLAVSRIQHQGRTLFVGLLRDISEQKRAEAEIERLAFYDGLTGLPNRRLLLDRLEQALAASRRSRQHGALLFIDIDNFKAINDGLGQEQGDQLLRAIAMRLQAVLRGQDTVARWGGDEFVVMLPELGLERQQAELHVESAVDKLLRVMAQAYHLDGHEQHCTPSIGAVICHGADGEATDLVQHAEQAMYQAKNSSRSHWSFFDPVAQAALLERVALEAELHNALDLGQFELHLQAQVGHDGRLIGAETLLRWRHPQRGMVSPAVFIPIAEQTGLIGPLGNWVMERACELLRLWSADAELGALSLAVNVSAHQFHRKDYLAATRQLLARSGVPTDRLKIELTESALISDVDAVVEMMQELRRLGLSFSLDDFGTGYSSLAYLKRLPLSQLKIDQSFVRDLLTDANALAIARAVIQLGDSLGLQVIAEGVETLEQREVLAAHGCHAFQGYLFSRPLPVNDFLRLARDWPRPQAG